MDPNPRFLLLRWFESYDPHEGFLTHQRINRENKQITDKTYDESVMKTRLKQPLWHLEIPKVSNNSCPLKYRSKRNSLVEPRMTKQQTRLGLAQTILNNLLYVGSILEFDALPAGVQLKREAKLLIVIWGSYWTCRLPHYIHIKWRLKTWTFIEIDIIPLFIKESFQTLYGCSKMILLCPGEDPIQKAVLAQEVTSLWCQTVFMILLFFFSSALLKTQMTLTEKIISFRTFSDLPFKKTKL